MDVEVAGRYEEVQKGGRSVADWTLKQGGKMKGVKLWKYYIKFITIYMLIKLTNVHIHALSV